MEEFTLLFMAISSVTLTDQEGSITWRWTRDGKFIVTLAYKCQFRGSFTSLLATKKLEMLCRAKGQIFSLASAS
jgi:hypothetical protein